MKAKILEMYLDYVNNFLTIPCFAEFYGISKERAVRILVIGIKLNRRLQNDKRI